MKAIFEFDLNDPDEQKNHTRMLKSLDLVLVLSEITEWLRSTEKYNKTPMTREEFYEILHARDIHLDELLN